MIPVTQAAVSLFGASLGVSSGASSTSTPVSAPATSGIDAGMATGGILPADGSLAAPPAPFADLLTEAVGQVQHLEEQAKAAIQGLISGQGVDVHEVMIATQKAGMGFELMLSVRNKALAAYQQVMGMQF